MIQRKWSKPSQKISSSSSCKKPLPEHHFRGMGGRAAIFPNDLAEDQGATAMSRWARVPACGAGKGNAPGEGIWPCFGGFSL